MIPRTHTIAHTPAWPGVGRSSLPETCLAALRPIAIAAPGIYLADIDICIDIDGARGLESEKKKTGPGDPDTAGLGFR